MNPTAEPNRQPTKRRRSLPAAVLPQNREDRRASAILSALLHILLIALLIAPVATHAGEVVERPQGAGGAGPAGGGGGGRHGTGGVQEHVAYVQVAPPPTPVVVPTPQLAVVPPPVVQPVVPPVVPPPQVVKPAEVVAEAKPEPKVEVPKVEATAPNPGTGGGSGHDGSTGNGPGSGGGVGSGIGTGRGSGNGPGTGGGNQANYAPSPTEMFIPPLPFPDKVRGFHLVAEYDIDETGKIIGFNYTHTPDSGYNRRLDDVLKSFKFRPGTKPDGTPIRMKTQITYDF